MSFDVVIAGGGIVGLATALKITEKSPHLRVALLEKETGVARHQTGNNSGVIHSGIYYKPGSLKAVNCIKGYRMLLEFCDANGIAYDLCGKVIVATEEWELPILETIYRRGIENGLDKNKKIGAGELGQYEPHAIGTGAIHVPYTGIIDYKKVAEKLAELFQSKGGFLLLGEEVKAIRRKGVISEIQTCRAAHQTRLFINCGGLYCDKIARMQSPELDVAIVPFRGEYYEIKPEKRHLVRSLIYPVPDPNFPFLGVHFTRMIDGGVEAGPNAVFAFGRQSYGKKDFHFAETCESLRWPGFCTVARRFWKTGLGEYYRSFSKAAFTRALQKLVPEIAEDDLIPGGAGIRAQACHRDGTLLDDFYIKEVENAIHVLNAPSPAATSSLSIGDTISDWAIARF